MRRLTKIVGALVLLVAVVAVVAAVVMRQPTFGRPLEGARLARAQANPLWQDGRFANPLPPAAYTTEYVWSLLKGQFGGNEVRTPPAPLPAVAVDPASWQAAPGLRAFWIGHASVYVELDGVRLLLDPIFSDHASPLPVGPRRFQPPPVALAALPPIDAVLITHDHYDHLDMPTVQHLAARGSLFFVPLGIGAHLEGFGVPAAQIRELEWWQEAPLKGLRIVCTPSRHYSGRRIGDANATLWSSWSVLGPSKRFYASGDTGWYEHFAQIGERFGPFDMAFVKIGAYGPGAQWLDIHMSAEDAVRAAVAVRAKRMFPVHWATFNLAFHDWDEPVRRALAAARGQPLELVTPRLGEIVDADRAFVSQPWWESVRPPAR